MTDQPQTGPDLQADGADSDEISDDRPLLGHVDGEPVLLVRDDGALHAMSATCSHYGGPLAEGVFDGRLVRCPWHHACFDPATGAAVRAPALEALDIYDVTERDGRVFVGAKRQMPELPPAAHEPDPLGESPSSIVIIGGGAAGEAAAEALRRDGYEAPVTLLSADDHPPYDRPNLSKQYLSGEAGEDWLPLREESFFEEHEIDLRLGQEAQSIDAEANLVTLEDGSELEYGALLLATGAEPIRPPIEGSDQDHVHVLRDRADCERLIAAAEGAERAVLVGASFIGTEVAAALRTRGLAVEVVEQESLPLAAVLGEEFGEFVRHLHEENDVRFHLERSVQSIGDTGVVLDSGEEVSGDLVVVGVGVRPRTELAESAGLEVDDGVLVNQYLETTAPGVWAAGDITRWPDRHSRRPVRIEHWAVAQRQGQVAARNMIGHREAFTDVPFFWSEQFGVTIRYVGHAEDWDELELEGSLESRDATARFRENGRTVAVASVNRDLDSLRTELEFERSVGSNGLIENPRRPAEVT
jgi:NADPH-dependent 2,4-dienoyl-CoA reductase/sulfur reductase-like enzyme/nitrite reductase/ring-hydroxylating ferredoxin subunit